MLIAWSIAVGSACAGFAAWVILRRKRERAVLPDVLEAASGRAALLLDARGELVTMGAHARAMIGFEGRCDSYGLEDIPIQGLRACIFAAQSPELDDARSAEPLLLWSASGCTELEADVVPLRPARGPMPAILAISPLSKVSFTLDESFAAEIELDLTSDESASKAHSSPSDSLPKTVATATSCAKTPFDGLRLLLAEDSPDNQLLMSYVLMGLGASVVLVENGEEAVTRACAEDYDIILLDLHMPILDGFDAAKIIRDEVEGAILVAVTAREDVRGSSLASDFDACLVKPLRRSVLIDTVEHLLNASRIASEREAQDIQNEWSELLEDPEFRAMADSFKESIPARLTAMREARVAEDYAMLESLAHQLRGAAGGYGLVEISAASAQIEDLLRSGSREESPIGDAMLELEAVAADLNASARQFSVSTD